MSAPKMGRPLDILAERCRDPQDEKKRDALRQAVQNLDTDRAARRAAVDQLNGRTGGGTQ